MSTPIPFILYNTPDSQGRVQVYVKDDTLWATQKAISELFDVSVSSVSKHLRNIYEEEELTESATIAKNEIVVSRGFRGEVKEDITFYNLDAIISVGYRVNSRKATKFRQWATQTLNDYIRKGFVMDDELSFITPLPAKRRLKSFGKALTTRRIIWGFSHGSTLRKVAS